jgi:AcrR family transcriptional regulator
LPAGEFYVVSRGYPRATLEEADTVVSKGRQGAGGSDTPLRLVDTGRWPIIDADAAVLAGRTPPSARIPRDRQRILAAAITFIDQEGLPGLTMRRLGRSLGVEAMSLYRYIPGREELLDGVVDTIINEMYDDEEILPSPQHGWQDFLQRLAHGVRRIALAHPKAFPLVASRPPEAPWLRPPLRNLKWVESFLDGLCAEGFSDDAAVAAYRAFTSFLLGHLLLEVSALGADVGPLDVLEDEEREDSSLEEYPHVKRMDRALAEDHSATEFEESLENLLDRIALLQMENK